MDLRKTIEDLRREMGKLDRAIASLEELQGGITVAAVETKCRSRRLLSAKSSENLHRDNAGDGRAQQPAIAVPD
jgi:hypothetical protein